MTDARYPVGKFSWPAAPLTTEQRLAHINTLTELPAQLATWVKSAPDGALDRTYREGGWTARQVIHHIADSHLNSYTRFRLALTEDRPVIKPYEEALWAQLPDAATGDVEPSLALIAGLHARWVALLQTLTEEQWARTFVHPEHGREMGLDATLALYAWHSQHHLAHLGLVG